MTVATIKEWTQDFGLDSRQPPNLFTNKNQISPSTPQAHLLRRAFDVLKVDGILCVDHSPLAYFKLLKRISPEIVFELHKQFWNHSGASLLVLMTDESVHVYSGMTRPEPKSETSADPSSLVVSLPRIANHMKEFVVAIESGEFFHTHHRSFNPAHRVDRDLLDNLRNTREKLDSVTRKRIPAQILDALLCRLVFTCYLFDRDVIGEGYLNQLGIKGVTHLRDLLSNAVPTKAKDALYRLFEKLKEDFNGDLFSNDLVAEKELIQDKHISTLNDFFQGTDVKTGQLSFWPYNFEFIPIETISAIYERFLKASDEQNGAFYTPRFLAEVVLDLALDGKYPLIGKRFLDPACGSGIFLVGLFNRIAEEWKQANPTARNDRKSKELMQLMKESLFGVDISLTACRITAFSLYLAYLDQLSPSDIQSLQAKGHALPRLVIAKDEESAPMSEIGNIRQVDFFDASEQLPKDVSLVIGNPPWGSKAKDDTPAGRWCVTHSRPLPNKQIAAAFIWKATEHVAESGRICFVLPHGVLFNHSTTAIPFQKAWVQSHAIDRVLNLADFQRFLFEKAGHPAVVVSYRKNAPANTSHRIEYWGPKADWTVTKAEVITISPQDRTKVSVREVLQDLDGPDAPQIWKQRFWATGRDVRLLDRLALYPRLRDVVRQTSEDVDKPWCIAAGLRLFGPNDRESARVNYQLPTRSFVQTSNPSIDLFLNESECEKLKSRMIESRGNYQSPEVFIAPHVLFTKGFSQAAFANCDVAFLEAVRGIHGPKEDSDKLCFLAAYLRTSVARYFLFHTSSNWGISRQEVHVEEVLRLPFPTPEQSPDPKRARQIVRDVAKIVDVAAQRANADFVDRAEIVRMASVKIEPLVEEYFDILPAEKALIEDTIRVTIDSTRPTRAKPLVPTLVPATPAQQEAYRDRVCEMLNGWAKSGPFAVRGYVQGSGSLGVGIAVLEKVKRADANKPIPNTNAEIIQLLDMIRKAIPRKHATLDVVRGVIVFDNNRLYLVKPIGQRFWTQTAAMNDADEIASTILMRSSKGDA
jgi:type I restriction-modification system DNA methylase subunit